jgi:hypothetical protein
VDRKLAGLCLSAHGQHHPTLDNVDTTAAFDFHNQLNSTQLLLSIEVGDASFRLEQMREFLEKNY